MCWSKKSWQIICLFNTTALRNMFAENEAEIQEALKADLGRPTWEGLYYDILLPLTYVPHVK